MKIYKYLMLISTLGLLLQAQSEQVEQAQSEDLVSKAVAHIVCENSEQKLKVSLLESKGTDPNTGESDTFYFYIVTNKSPFSVVTKGKYNTQEVEKINMSPFYDGYFYTLGVKNGDFGSTGGIGLLIPSNEEIVSENNAFNLKGSWLFKNDDDSIMTTHIQSPESLTTNCKVNFE